MEALNLDAHVRPLLTELMHDCSSSKGTNCLTSARHRPSSSLSVSE